MMDGWVDLRDKGGREERRKEGPGRKRRRKGGRKILEVLMSLEQ